MSRPALRGLSNYGVTWLELFEGPLKPLGQLRVIDAHNVLRRGQERQTPKLGVNDRVARLLTLRLKAPAS